MQTLVSRKIPDTLDHDFNTWRKHYTPAQSRDQAIVLIMQEFLGAREREIKKWQKEDEQKAEAARIAEQRREHALERQRVHEAGEDMDLPTEEAKHETTT